MTLTRNLRSWLQEKGSLTQRAKRCCTDVNVCLLTNQWQKPTPNEAILLKIAPRQLVFIREIFMLCNGEKWWFARTVMPNRILTGKYIHLRYLGTKPLANIIFSDPDIQRSPFEFAALSAQNMEFQRAIQGEQWQPDTLWARRCRLHLAGTTMSLTEVFLPAMQARIQYTHHT